MIDKWLIKQFVRHMGKLDTVFLQGASLYRQGRFADAERVYQKILRRRPNDFDAVHFLGLIALQTERTELGVELMEKAIRLDPSNADAQSNLGNGLRALNRLPHAVTCYEKAIALRPDHADAWFNRGVTLLTLKHPEAAVASFDQTIALKPGLAEAYNSRGTAFQALGRFADAIASHDTAVALKPDYPAGHNDRGAALLALGRHDEAVASFDKVIAPRPGYANAHSNRGIALLALNRPEEAVASFDQAIALKLDLADVHTMRGIGLLALMRPAGAVASHDKAIALRPDFAEAFNNRGVALVALNRHEEALESYGRATALKPDLEDAYWNQSLAYLALGDFGRGWDLFEWRWKLRLAQTAGELPAARWHGETPIEGKTILVRAEQGLGDTLQFCRYVPMLAARATVVLEVPRPLVRLLSGLEGVARIVATGDPLPAFDVWTSTMSLPGIFRTTVETIPATVPYLRADPRQVAAWRSRLAALPGRKIGLVWAGSPRLDESRFAAVDRRRSMTLRHYALLASIPGLCLVSLQKGEPAGQARTPPDGMVLHDWTSGLDDFADTAALVEALDLVISVDTAVAHLAGALGKPVWILNRYDQCWRWLRGRVDSPWYPSARLFQQRTPGDWSGVLHDVAEAARLEAFAD